MIAWRKKDDMSKLAIVGVIAGLIGLLCWMTIFAISVRNPVPNNIVEEMQERVESE